MANDLEEFLRRAAAKRQANTNQQTPQRGRSSSPPHRQPPSQVVQAEQVYEAEVIEEPVVVEAAYDAYAQDEYVPPSHSKHSEHASANTDKSSTVKGQTTAEGLIKLLRHPDGIKQAILVKEILQRPEHRW